MSILPQAMERSLGQRCAQLSCQFLPGSCLLCGADSQQALLCADCGHDLPHLTGAHCPHCASPTTHGERCGSCLQQPPAFDASAALFAYAFPIVRLIHALKYGHQLAIAQWLGKTLATRLNPADCDAIIGLPLHPSRLQERGFNQSIEIARPISRAWQRPLYIDVLQRTRAPPQAELPLKARQANVRGAFECVADLSGQRILLLDDVMTTGATLDECARVLKLHGASSVTVAVAARALKH